MDLKKMKVEKFSNFLVKNFPKEYDPGIKSSDTGKNIEVILFYIGSIDDVAKFVKLCNESNLEKDNRVIMVYEKGRKDGVNRDSIFIPFKEGKYTGFVMKAPMLCSVSDKLSAFVQQKSTR